MGDLGAVVVVMDAVSDAAGADITSYSRIFLRPTFGLD